MSQLLSNLRVHLLTWNVVGRDPEEDLLDALGLIDEAGDHQITLTHDKRTRPDIYVIGLQELSSLTPQSFLTGPVLGLEDSWGKRIRETLADYDYVKVKSCRLQGLLILLFVSRHHLTHIRGVETQFTRTGLRGMWGNKGAVTIRANVYGCSMCFVNCHLAAHEEELQQRIDDYNTIVDNQVFADPETERILYHDYIFWIGDLNFRITEIGILDIDQMICQIKKREDDDSDDDIIPSWSRILLANDQLTRVMKSGEAFAELQEVPPNFKPSYKYIIGTNKYDLHRRPSWTDRILFKANADVYENVTLTVEPIHYGVHNNYVQSDHKPVTGIFNLKVFKGYVENRVEFSPLATGSVLVGGDIQCQYNIHNDCEAGWTPSSWDWIGLYKADFTNIDDYLTYMWASSASPDITATAAGDSTLLPSPSGQKFDVTFTQVTPTSDGPHRFLYVTSDSSNVLGMSESFQISTRQRETSETNSHVINT